LPHEAELRTASHAGFDESSRARPASAKSSSISPSTTSGEKESCRRSSPINRSPIDDAVAVCITADGHSPSGSMQRQAAGPANSSACTSPGACVTIDRVPHARVAL
jgi:hypothetical protein